jgi:Serine dehydrogenase proteinase
MEQEKPRTFQDVATAIADKRDADVLFVNAGIYRPLAAQVSSLCHQRRRRKNVILILVTGGGDANAAYRIARCLQGAYERFSLFLTGYCKSAGTLVAIGAHELIVAESGELGPLDVQMSKPDELMLRQSGLTATAALSSLHEQAFTAFEHFFLTLISKSGNAITTRTATHIATQLTSGLFAPMYEHVDPMHVGEAGRALQVAIQYGELLRAESRNINPMQLSRLTTGFASHDFVIDLPQIKELFANVRVPDEIELLLAKLLGVPAVEPEQSPIVAYLSTQASEPAEQVPSEPEPRANGQDNETTTGNRQTRPEQAPRADTVEGGATATGESQSADQNHIVSIRSTGSAGARGRGPAT